MECAQPKCTLVAVAGEYLCDIHERVYDNRPAAAPDSEYEAARIDPTTDRDRWDVFGEDGAA